MSKRKTIWNSIPGLEQRLSEIVRSGVLVEHNQKEAVDKIFHMLNDEFSGAITEADINLTKQSIRNRLDVAIWTKEVERLIETVAHNHRPLDEFLEHCPWVPQRLANDKFRELVGKSANMGPVKFGAGFGRISRSMEDIDTENFNLPEEPVSVSMQPGDTVAVLNGVNLGIPYSGLIRDNPARRALEDAELRGDVAVFVTNFLNIDTKKASGAATVFRALASGRNVNTRALVPAYAQKANAILDQRPVGGIIFQTTEEIFFDSLAGWQKIATTPKNKPEFSGPVFIILGRGEEEFLATATYWEASYWTRVRQIELDIDIEITKKAIAAAEGQHEAKELSEELQVLQDEKSRTIISNVHPEEWQRYYKQTLAFFVREVEKAVPNSKVISISSARADLGGKTVEFYIPSHTRVNDRLLADYTKKYGPRVLRGDMADFVVICHPYALGYRSTARERDNQGVRGSCEAVVAPITVDEKYLRNVFNNQVRKLHKIAKTVQDERFESGMMRIQLVNDMLMPINFLTPSLGKNGRRKKLKNKLDSNFIWIMVATDPHFGSPTREHYEIGDGRFRGVSEAVIEMMRREGVLQPDKMPVHMFVVNDDPTQGHHFPTEQQPHPNKAPFPVIEEFVRSQSDKARKTSDVDEVRRILNKSHQALLGQFLRRGEIWTQDQVLWFMEQFIEPNIDFYSSVLHRADKAGIVIKGVSDLSSREHELPYDARDPGIINFGTGNHFQKSAAGELTEGVLYAKVLLNHLKSESRWQGSEQALKKLVRAPLYGHLFIAYGAVQVGNGYLWTLDLRSAPPKMQGWEDTLRGWVNIDLRRGNYSRIFDLGKTLKICGDKHFFGSVNTPYAFYHMSAPDTPTDSFAEWAGGFPPNNTGVSFVGLPVEGPDSGPVIVRTLRYDRIRDYFEDGTGFDWDLFLPNPA